MAFDVDEEMSGMEEKIIAIMCFKFLTIIVFQMLYKFVRISMLPN